MRVHIFSWFVLVSATTCLAAQTRPGTDEYDKKIKAIQDQIDELRKQQDALRKEKKEQERAKQAKLEAEEANQYAQVEVRGKLGKVPVKTIVYDMGRPITPNTLKTDIWHVTVKSTVAPVHFTSKALRELAEKYAGKEVIAHGVLESRRVKVFTPRHFHFHLGPLGGEPHFEEIEVNVATVTVTSLKLAEQLKP